MKQNVRMIYTICYQTGVDRYDQGFSTVDTEIELPDAINGRPLRDYSFVGIEFKQGKDGAE